MKKLRPCIITIKSAQRIAQIKRYAKVNCFSLGQLLQRQESDDDGAVGDDLNFRITIPMGYRVVYSEEEQALPLGLCAHFSFSLDDKEKSDSLPSREAVVFIIQAFGIWDFSDLKDAVSIWLEGINDGNGTAVNILIKINPPLQLEDRKEVNHE